MHWIKNISSSIGYLCLFLSSFTHITGMEKTTSLPDFVVIVTDQSPHHEHLCVKVMQNTDAPHREVLIACVLYMHQCVSTVVDACQKKESMTPFSWRFFPKALKFLEAARVTCAEKFPTMVQPYKDAYPNHTSYLMTKGSELLAAAGTHREIPVPVTQENDTQEDGNRYSEEHQDSTLICQSLCELLQECVSLKSLLPQALQWSDRLSEVVLFLAQQRPELLDLAQKNVSDFTQNPFLCFLLETRTKQLLQSLKAEEQKNSPQPGTDYTILLELLKNKKMIMAYSKSLPSLSSSQSTTDQESSSPAPITKGKEEKDDNFNDFFEQAEEEERRTKKEEEYRYLQQKMIRLVAFHNEFSVHDALTLHTLISDEELVTLLIGKLTIEQEIAELATLVKRTTAVAEEERVSFAHTTTRFLMALKDQSTIIRRLQLMGTSEQARQPLVKKRAVIAGMLLALLEKAGSILDQIVHHSETIFDTKELQIPLILCRLVEVYRKDKDSHGTDLLIVLCEKALALLELLELLPKKELFEMIDKRELRDLLKNAQLLEEKKIALELDRKNTLAQAKRELGLLEQAIRCLVEKNPQLSTMGLLKITNFIHNKCVLLLLVQKLLTQPEEVSSKSAAAEELTYNLAVLGTSIRLAAQTRFATMKKLHSKKAKRERLLEETNHRITELSPDVEAHDKSYEETVASVRSIAECSTLLIDKLASCDTFLSPRTLKKSLDELESTSKEASPLVDSPIQKLRMWQGNADQLLKYGPLLNSESERECTAFALLINNHLHVSKQDLDAKKEELKKAIQKRELLTMQLANHESTTRALQAADEQARTDLQEIAGALHALAAQYPQIVSPELLVQYPKPQAGWSLWYYASGKACTIA